MEKSKAIAPPAFDMENNPLSIGPFIIDSPYRYQQMLTIFMYNTKISLNATDVDMQNDRYPIATRPMSPYRVHSRKLENGTSPGGIAL